MAGAKHCYLLPRKAVESSSSEILSTQQYVDQSNLICGGSVPEDNLGWTGPMI